MPGRLRPTPPVVVGASLAQSRRAGKSFDGAWSIAMRAVRDVLTGRTTEARHEWLAVMEATRAEWQAAYEGIETHFSLAVAGRETFANAVADYLTDPWAVAAA